MYAIIETGGKQYRVEEGTRLRVESLPHQVGEEIALDKVLLLQADSGLKIGKPVVTGAKVTAQVVANDRAKKVIVFKKRSKKTYKKWIGHRQNYTELLIKSITGA
ncbi:MAG: 50S ribosomal protein L21 [Elusimicrobiota bacterium]|jgi:large subunit ribosomal protein L21